jgi:hypothetical protein
MPTNADFDLDRWADLRRRSLDAALRGVLDQPDIAVRPALKRAMAQDASRFHGLFVLAAFEAGTGDDREDAFLGVLGPAMAVEHLWAARQLRWRFQGIGPIRSAENREPLDADFILPICEMLWSESFRLILRNGRGSPEERLVLVQELAAVAPTDDADRRIRSPADANDAARALTSVYGGLIRTSIRLGGRLARLGGPELEQIDRYADAAGTAFPLGDLLIAPDGNVGDEEAEALLSILGRVQAWRRATAAVTEAIGAAGTFPHGHALLRLARLAVDRVGADRETRPSSS